MRHRATARRNAFGFFKPRVYSASTRSYHKSEGEARAVRLRQKAEAAAERQRRRAEEIERRKERLEDLRFEAEEKRLKREIERIEAKERQAEKKLEKAEAKRDHGDMSEAEFTRVKAHMEAEIQKQEKAKEAAKDKLANPCARTRKAHVSDRAKRYRANQPGCRPSGKKKCKLCGSTHDVMVDHADGDESNGRRSNLRWLCRSCNTFLGAEMARTGQGRRTVQYNPAQGKGAQNVYQYLLAVLQHTRRAHDEGGRIIHDTPKAKRREYAAQFWQHRKQSAAAGREYERENPKRRPMSAWYPAGTILYQNDNMSVNKQVRVINWAGEFETFHASSRYGQPKAALVESIRTGKQYLAPHYTLSEQARNSNPERASVPEGSEHFKAGYRWLLQKRRTAKGSFLTTPGADQYLKKHGLESTIQLGTSSPDLFYSQEFRERYERAKKMREEFLDGANRAWEDILERQRDSNPRRGRSTSPRDYWGAGGFPYGKVQPPYAVRFIRPDQQNELVNLYHLARVPLSGTGGGRYERMLWASSEFSKAHPEVSATGAYKDLDGMLQNPENPAHSAAQYRLAQAVLSGTARDSSMPPAVAREIVERTPAHLRSEYSTANPSEPVQQSLEYNLGYSLGQRDRDTASLKRSADELRANFLSKFDPTRAALKRFTSGYEDGYRGSARENPKYTRDELERWDIDKLDRAAFGHAQGETITVQPSQLRIKYKGDLDNPKAKYAAEGMKWVRSVDLSEPVELSVGRDGKLQLEDGHHRYFAAKKLHRSLTGVITKVEGKPIEKLLKQNPLVRSDPPKEYQIGPGPFGHGYTLQYRHDELESVYKRDYNTLYDLTRDLRDKFGGHFANKIERELKATGTVKHRNPTEWPRIYPTKAAAEAAWYDSAPGRNDRATYRKVKGGWKIYEGQDVWNIPKGQNPALTFGTKAEYSKAARALTKAGYTAELQVSRRAPVSYGYGLKRTPGGVTYYLFTDADYETLDRLVPPTRNNPRRFFGRRPGPGEPKQIAFTTDKRGKLIAYNMHGRGSGFETSPVRMSLEEAKLLLATGAAIKVPWNESSADVYIAEPLKDYGLAGMEPASKLVNPEPGADEEYKQACRTAELFHGRPVQEEITVDEQIREHDWYCDLGPLVELKVKTPTKGMATIPFSLTEEGTVRLWTSPNGKQFYLRGGDQELDLAPIGMGEKTDWFRDLMLLGPAYEITYRDKKRFHKYKLTDYYHKLGERSKVRPVLIYNSLAKKMELAGGKYAVETRELVDGMSPGIVD